MEQKINASRVSHVPGLERLYHMPHHLPTRVVGQKNTNVKVKERECPDELKHPAHPLAQ
jgi:hypothetical protein